MQALQVRDHAKGAELVEIEEPVPGPGEIGVRIEACGLNFADLLMIKGTYQETPEPPFTLGLEIAGRVEALGPGVEGPAVGARVAVYAGRGGLAEYGAFPADRAVVLPDAMPAEEAAGFLVAYGTSHLALTRRARLQPGERLLVLGAAGGVGLTAVEIGAALGAEVIAAARGADRLAVAKAAGATHLLDTDTDDLRDGVKALGGADVVYDAVGGELFRAAFRAINPEGRILAIGFASGDVPQIPANHLLVKNISVLGFNWGGYLRFAPEVLTAGLAELFDLYTEGRLRPHVGARFPLSEAQAALDLLKSRKSTGKIVVCMGRSSPMPQ
ncbi:zinc-binding dehydrogenase [Rhodobacterales bacterium HKCCE2091]|nr:zinc-binding dehydrogenase [Rhodobacterales bacterium HKCCE2091]